MILCGFLWVFISQQMLLMLPGYGLLVESLMNLWWWKDEPLWIDCVEWSKGENFYKESKKALIQYELEWNLWRCVQIFDEVTKGNCKMCKAYSYVLFYSSADKI